MGQGVGPCLPKDLGRLGTASPGHLACRAIRRPDLARVPGAEDRGHDPGDTTPELPACGLPHAVARQVHDASLPGRTPGRLPYGPLKSLVGVSSETA